MEGVCQFNQKGFCKFGDSCRKRHVKEICSNQNCNSTSCNLRHPRNCKFFTLFGYCKFSEDCAFKHTLTKSHSEFKTLKEQLETLTNTITEMNQVMDHIKNELEIFKSERKLEGELQTTQEKLLQEHICDICSYKARSATVLKSHITRKHKKEVLRDNDADISIHLSVSDDSRDEDIEEVSEYEHENEQENETTDISWKVALKTLNTDTLTCDECGAIFPDEEELYDEHYWFNHRSSACDLKYEGCQTKPSDDQHPFGLWYISCAYCWTKHLDNCPEIMEMCPRKPSGFQALKF